MHRPARTPLRRIVVFGAFAALVGHGTALAVELPKLRHGLWQIRGTEDGTKIDTTKCTSPSEDLKTENATLVRTGCKLSSIRRSGNRYTFTSDCEVKTRRGLSLKSSRTSELKVEGGAAFELRVRGSANGRPVDDVVRGKRIGECGK